MWQANEKKGGINVAWQKSGGVVQAPVSQHRPCLLWTPKFIFVVEFDCAEYVVRFLTALFSKTLPLFGVSYELEEQSTKFSTYSFGDPVHKIIFGFSVSSAPAQVGPGPLVCGMAQSSELVAGGPAPCWVTVLFDALHTISKSPMMTSNTRSLTRGLSFSLPLLVTRLHTNSTSLVR